jgi:hypothetical protein
MKAGDLVKFNNALFSSAPKDIYIVRKISHKWARLHNYSPPVDIKLLEVISEGRRPSKI